jgi:membrane-bound lytic murein transglycosylase D
VGFFLFRKALIPLVRGFLFAMAVLALSPACSSTRSHAPTLVSPAGPAHHPHDTTAAPTRGKVVAAAADSLALADSSGAGEEDTVYETPADLIEEAKSNCDDKDFAAADSTLKQAIHLIEAMDQVAEGTGAERQPSSRYFDEIAAIYKEKMPPPYTMPEEIAMAVFQGQIMRSIDSLNEAPDSASLAALSCQKGLEYDVPMVVNKRVQRALSFYIHNRDITIDRWFSRASYYLPLMKKMFADSGLPKDLAYLPLIESGFNPLAYSYANASGIWQFIASTGKLYGLKRSFWIDERRDPIRSTEAAIGYMRKLYGQFGDWHLALAAYNCGENGVSHCIARYKINDYWHLKRLPKQTRNYVPFYLAALTIAKNPKCFGVVMPATDTLPLDTVHVKECISLSDIAAGLNIRPDSLQKMNPHILRWCTPPDSAGGLLYLPAGKKKAWNAFLAQLPPEKRVRWYRYEIKHGDDIAGVGSKYNVPADALAAINRIGSAQLVPGHHVFIPVSLAPLPPTVAYALPPESEIKALDLPDYEYSGVALRHRVRPGDNLGRIARHYHVSIVQLCRWNHVTGRTLLRPGRILVVSRPQPPVESQPPPALAKAAPVQTPSPAAAPALTPAPAQAAGPAPAVAIAPAQPPAGGTHVVQIGETPFSISRKNNISIKDLAALNGLDMAHPTVKIGQTLVLKPQSAPPVFPPAKTDSARLDTAARKTALLAQKIAAAAGKPDTGAPPARAQVALQNARRFHVVAKGEDVFRISIRYGVSIDSLLSVNRIADPLLVHAGDTLVIPPGKDPAVSAPPEPSRAGVIYYKVKDGDTLLGIAAEFGVSVDSLYKVNKLAPDTVLIPGKVIRVVKASGM